MNDATAIGQQVLRLEQVESTNKTAAELIGLSQAPHGTVILARTQSAGRGQRGRAWLSQPGEDLTLSVVLWPQDLRAQDQFALSKLAALAVRDTVAACVPGPVKVKWPNDVLVDRRKVAGILIECDLVGDHVGHAVVGIGLNVNSRDREEDLAATSLLLESGRPWDLEVVLQELLAALRHRWQEWVRDPLATDNAYAACLWAAGRWSPMLLDGEPCALRPMEVDRIGRLLVEHEGGRVAAYGLDRLRFAPR